MNIVASSDNAKLYKHKSSFISLMPYYMEQMSLVRRLRFLYEHLCGGYEVYYLSIDTNIVGYCVMAPGGRRLKCSTMNDLVLGPYYILPEFRRKGYAKLLVRMTLTYCTYKNYNNVYCWIHNTNIPSIKTVEACGMQPTGESLNVVGKFRRLIINENGDYIVYKY